MIGSERQELKCDLLIAYHGTDDPIKQLKTVTKIINTLLQTVSIRCG